MSPFHYWYATISILSNREKVKQVEISEKASLATQAKDEELSALKVVSMT